MNDVRSVDCADPPPANESLAMRVEVLRGSVALKRAGELSTDAPRPHPADDLRWLAVLERGLGHRPYLLEASRDGERVGLLPLALVRSVFFGRFLVGLPYINSGGLRSSDPGATDALIERAVRLADELGCRFLELRHETAVAHPLLSGQLTSKVHMRLDLPASADELWSAFKPGVRNQIRKAEKREFEVRWGGEDLLPSFYGVFARNMRDLGTPVFGMSLFRAILDILGGDAEICCVFDGTKPVAGAVLTHGDECTEVPSASSLRSYNSSNANMLLYWHLLQRTIEKGRRRFDFGRSTIDSGPFRFKKQWGAIPEPACWQYYLRSGLLDALRPENSRNQRLIRIWQRLPVWLTRLAGPVVARGIP